MGPREDPPDAEEVEGLIDVVPVSLSDLETRTLTRSGATMPVLLAALARMLQNLSEGGSITIDLERHGRDGQGLEIDLDVSRTVGWFTTLFPFNLPTPENSTAESLVDGVAKRLAGVPSDGLSYGILRYMIGDESVVFDPSVCVNFLGNLETTAPGGFQKIPTPGVTNAAENVPSHLLSINGWIADGRWRGEWSFDRRRIGRETVQEWAQRFEKELRNIVAALEGDSMGPGSSPAMDDAQLNSILSQVSFDGGGAAEEEGEIVGD
ncbi:MAG: condensation domain-containing protein [Verrucomicrobiota bacterium]